MLTDRVNRIAVGLIALVIVLIPAQIAHADGGPEGQSGDVFDTNARANSDGVDIKGTQHHYSSGDAGKDGDAGGRKSPVSTTRVQFSNVNLGEAIFGTDCGNTGTDGCVDLPPAEPADPGTPGATITIEDLARFLPADAVLHAEPDGWAVVGVPANFWVAVEPVTVDGELLGEVAQVHFTPVAYRWEYGDGATKTTRTPGATWEALGQDELTATPTSHLYRARGTIRADVAVIYSAEYRVAGGDWVPVVGAVTDTTPPQPVLVVTERTVLTNGDA